MQHIQNMYPNSTDLNVPVPPYLQDGECKESSGILGQLVIMDGQYPIWLPGKFRYVFMDVYGPIPGIAGPLEAWLSKINGYGGYANCKDQNFNWENDLDEANIG